MRETLEEKVKEETGYQRAQVRRIALMEAGLDLGTKGKITASREEFHEIR